MALRPYWGGFLKLSLVSCPVQLYSAASSGGGVSFHWIHPKTNNRIQMRTFDPELGEVERKELVKGYEVEKDQYVILTQEEIDDVKLESNKTIVVESFVDAEDVDPLYRDKLYYMVPDGKMGAEAFAVIREAMRKQGKVALARVIMHSRERAVAIDVRKQGMLLQTLHPQDHVRKPDQLFDEIPEVAIDDKMVDIATRIIEQQSGKFEPARFEDRYETALRELIKSKMKGKRQVAESAPRGENVIDLMEALRRSLGQGGERGDKEKPAAARAAATPKRSSGGTPKRRTARR